MRRLVSAGVQIGGARERVHHERVGLERRARVQHRASRPSATPSRSCVRPASSRAISGAPTSGTPPCPLPSRPARRAGERVAQLPSPAPERRRATTEGAGRPCPRRRACAADGRGVLHRRRLRLPGEAGRRRPGRRVRRRAGARRVIQQVTPRRSGGNNCPLRLNGANQETQVTDESPDDKPSERARWRTSL